MNSPTLSPNHENPYEIAHANTYSSYKKILLSKQSETEASLLDEQAYRSGYLHCESHSNDHTKTLDMYPPQTQRIHAERSYSNLL